LYRVTENLMKDLAVKSPRWVVGGSDIQERLEREEAREELEGHLAREYDLELVEEARRRGRARIKEATWSAFEQTALNRRSSREVAQELGMRPAQVYQARYSVTLMLTEEIRRLQAGE